MAGRLPAFFLQCNPGITVVGLRGPSETPQITVRREVEGSEHLGDLLSAWSCDFITNLSFSKQMHEVGIIIFLFVCLFLCCRN